MSTRVFGVRITCEDYWTPATETTSIGLYNRSFALSVTAGPTDTVISVADATYAKAGDKAIIFDDIRGPLVVLIQSVNYVTNQITLSAACGGDFLVANNAGMICGSEFRWIKNDITDLSNWTSGLLLDQNGIGGIKRFADIVEGGNVAAPSSTDIAITNTAKFWKSITDLSISLIGARVEVLMFTDTTPTVLLDATCTKVSWTTDRYKIRVEQRIEELSTKINSIVNSVDNDIEMGGETDGKEIPATFGFWNDRPCKIVPTDSFVERALYVDRTTYKSNVLGADNLRFVWAGRPPYADQEIFPIDNSGPTVVALGVFHVIIGISAYWYDDNGSLSVGTHQLTDLEYATSDYSVYMIFVSGDGEGSGARRVDSATVTISGAPFLQSTIVVTTNLCSDGGVGGESTAWNTWVKFVKVKKSYEIDTWPCYGFLDNESISRLTELYFLLKGGQTKQVADTTTGEVTDSKIIPGYVHIPDGTIITDATTYPNANKADVFLDSFIDEEAVSYNWYHKFTPSSVSYEVVSPVSPGGSVTVTGTVADLTDGDPDTYMQFSATSTPTWGAQIRVFLTFRDLPTDIAPDEFYFGIKSLHDAAAVYTGAGELPFIKCEILDTFSSNYLEQFSLGNIKTSIDATISDLYDPTTVDTSVDFFREVDTTTGALYTATGKETFQLPSIEKIEQLNGQYFRITLYCPIAPGGTSTIKLYEICAYGKTKYSIKNDLFTYFLGRTFNDTWGARKIATTVMRGAPDILEHAVRLQRWPKNNTEPTGGWGKAYASNAFVNTTAFDSDDLDDVRDLYYANQIDGSKSTTAEIKKSICRNAMMLSFQKSTGEESVVALRKTQTTPTDTISLASIVSGSSVTIIEPDPSRIYCQPLIRFDKDLSTGKYNQTIEVTHTDDINPSLEDSAKAAYVIGLTGADATEVWNRCHALYLKAGSVNTAPTYLTDLEWCNGNIDYSKLAATRFLLDWTAWQGLRRIQFTVPNIYDAGSGTLVYQWEVGRRIYVQFLHETNNDLVECIVHSIDISCEAPFETVIEATMLDTYTAAYEIQEVLYTVAGGADADIQETLDTDDTQIQEVT